MTESKKIVFITVGTTSFDPLIAEGVSRSFARSCYLKFGSSVHVVVQIGRGIFSPPVYALNVKETVRDASSGEAIAWSFNIEVSNIKMEMEMEMEQKQSTTTISSISFDSINKDDINDSNSSFKELLLLLFEVILIFVIRKVLICLIITNGKSIAII